MSVLMATTTTTATYHSELTLVTPPTVMAHHDDLDNMALLSSKSVNLTSVDGLTTMLLMTLHTILPGRSQPDSPADDK